MKKSFIFITILSLVTATSAQTVSMTFTGRDAQNKYVPVSRVVVCNITKGWQKTLTWPDTVLVMNTTTVDDFATDGITLFDSNDQLEYVGFTTRNGKILESEHVIQNEHVYSAQTIVLLFGISKGCATDAKPCLETPTVADYDGNVYNTVQIGYQCWMRENLRTRHYADGTAIFHPKNSAKSNTSPYYYDYSTSSIPLEEQGYLYNWTAAMNGTNSSTGRVQGICPDGWHLPSDTEWRVLADYLGGLDKYICGEDSSHVAKALASTSRWSTSSKACAVGNSQTTNNTSGFSAVPAGHCYGMSFYDTGNEAYFWLSTEYNARDACYCGLYYNYADIGMGKNHKYFGFSVRCLRD